MPPPSTRLRTRFHLVKSTDGGDRDRPCAEPWPDYQRSVFTTSGSPIAASQPPACGGLLHGGGLVTSGQTESSMRARHGGIVCSQQNGGASHGTHTTHRFQRSAI